MDPDLEMLTAWKGGDTDAGDQLFERHFGRIYDFFAFKIDGDISDLVQRTFLVAVEKRDQFRGDAKFSTFLHAIARLELLKFFERKERGAKIDMLASTLADLASSPSSLACHKDDRALLVTALRQIPIDLQIALELHYYQHLRGPELALVLDVPQGTVRSRLRRGLERLREVLAVLGAGPRAEWDTDEGLEEWAVSLAPYKPTS